MENHTLATQSDLDQVRLAVLELAENLPLIHQPRPDNPARFANLRLSIIQTLTSELSGPPLVQVNDLLAGMNDLLAHQISLEMLEANITELRGEVDDLRSQNNHLQNQSQHHIPRLNGLIQDVQSQVAMNVTPSIDTINRTIGNLQVQFDAATHTSDRQNGK